MRRKQHITPGTKPRMPKIHRELGKYLINTVPMLMEMTMEAPTGMLRAVVWRVLNPYPLMMIPNSTPTPPIRFATAAKRKKNQVLGSVNASMNLSTEEGEHGSE